MRTFQLLDPVYHSDSNDLEECSRHNDSLRCSNSCSGDDISNLYTQRDWVVSSLFFLIMTCPFSLLGSLLTL